MFATLAGSPAVAGESRIEDSRDWLVREGYANTLRIRQVNIFGDGNPSNGIEDSRIDMTSPAWNSKEFQPWNMGAGTIHCDGRNRGSAVIVDAREHGLNGDGLIIATSAHVLFDLDRKRLFSECRFHYMALDRLPGYQSSIDLVKSRLGSFDPGSSTNSAGFGREDWAFLYVTGPIPGASMAANLRLRSFSDTAGLGIGRAEFRFIAYSPASDGIVISTACNVVESGPGDLGGGAWKGQLLDDCDSEDGASGGGLIASSGDQHYLVGIRSGAHWDGDTYPPKQYPHGPPSGATWDILTNTNFSRAIDQDLIDSLRDLVAEINRLRRLEKLHSL